MIMRGGKCLTPILLRAFPTVGVLSLVINSLKLNRLLVSREVNLNLDHTA